MFSLIIMIFFKISFRVFTCFSPYLSFMVVDQEIWRSEWSFTVSMELVFQDVCVKVDKKLILNNVSGLARSGELLAVMGPSGKALIVRLSPLFNSSLTFSPIYLPSSLYSSFTTGNYNSQNMTRKQFQIVKTLKQFLFSHL